ncbi:MAG: FMN-binding protein [Planctomycetes bacterium]|nr:FMN-binding protein [Planctomycetota bacterium]
MRDKPWYAVVYMFVVTAFFSSIVIGFAEFTKGRVESNKRIAFERSVLEVFGLSAGVPAGRIHEVFVESIREPDDDSGGAYVYVKDDDVKGYAVEIAGKGFWAPIKGILGLKADKETVTGISFYEQNETPGLGAQIESDAFREQFDGKRISLSGDPLIIKPVGAELGDNEVHAISGATQTCRRLGVFINEDVSKWLGEMAGKADD